MTDLPIKRAVPALRAAGAMIIPHAGTGEDGSLVRLVIRIEDNDIIARDFAAFLELLDHIYGRSSSTDFRSYALRQHGHFTFRSRQGSWELVAEKALGLAAELEPLVVLWLILKFLPSTLCSFASAFNHYQQGQLARINRKQIREQMKNDEHLGPLPAPRQAELARLLERVAAQEASLMPRVRRFFRRSFLGVVIEIKKSKDQNRPE